VLVKEVFDTTVHLTSRRAPSLWGKTIKSIWSMSDRDADNPTADTAWGVALTPLLVPLRGAEVVNDNTELASDATLSQTQDGLAVEEKVGSPMLKLGLEYEKLLVHEESDPVEGESVPAPAPRILPFSQLLRTAVKAVRRHTSPHRGAHVTIEVLTRVLTGDCCAQVEQGKQDVSIFDSEILAAVVQYKWEQISESMFYTMFVFYGIYLLLFTTTMLLFDSLTDSGEMWQRFVGWPALCATCIGMTFLLSYEWSQAAGEGWRYFRDFYNVLDLIGFGCTVTAIVLQVLVSVAELHVAPSILNSFKAVAGLLGWLKLLWFVRGANQQTAFLLNMLSEVLKDIQNFLIVLMVVLLAFTYHPCVQ
jgi:hypothetical protein